MKKHEIRRSYDAILRLLSTYLGSTDVSNIKIRKEKYILFNEKYNSVT